MSILVNKDTRLVVQGMTGSVGQFHTEQMLAYGTNVVAGCTPGKGGTSLLDVPVYDTMREVVKETGANASCIFVPPPFAADAILEAVDAELPLIVCITEGIPVMDMVEVRRVLDSQDKSRLIGPNCPGVITPDQCKIGIMPGHVHMAGRIGVVSKSGTLTYEAVGQLTALGIGQSTAVGIGGDPINGTNHLDVLKMFNDDDETEAIIMIGEIGGNAEAEAARWAKDNCNKPIAGFIAGATAPPGRRMGHAGAIVGGEEDTAEAKKKILAECGITVAETPSDMATALMQAWGK